MPKKDVGVTVTH